MTTTDTTTEVTTVHTVELPRAGAISALSNGVLFAATDPTRPMLTHIKLELEPNTATFVATDSYMLSRQVVDLPDWDGSAATVLIPASLAADAVKLAKKKENAYSAVVLSFDAVSVTIQVGGSTLTARTYDGDFPNYRQLIPTEETRPGTVEAVGLGAKNLGKLAKIVDDDGKALGTGTGSLFLAFDGPLKVITGHSPTVAGLLVLIMPVRK